MLMRVTRLRKRPVFRSKQGIPGETKNSPGNSDLDGLLLMCAAIIDRAHEDYITGTYRERKAIRNFINSEWFRIYTFNNDINADDVISKWNRDRIDYILSKGGYPDYADSV